VSIQSEWQKSSATEPAEFDLDYVEIKVQAVHDDKEIQVRIATSFNTDWQECRFEEWIEDTYDDDSNAAFEAIYPLLKSLRNATVRGDDRALLSAAIKELENRNAGLIRG